MRDSRKLLGLLVWLVVTFAAAALGGIASANAGDVYLQLDRPAWAPPAWLFGPVWTVLYLLQGVAACWIWRERGFGGARTALGLYLVQLAVNALWTWLFFACRQGALAFAEIVLLWLLIVATIAAFRRISPGAAALLLPYLLWVTYATALTWTVWQRNPGVLG